MTSTNKYFNYFISGLVMSFPILVLTLDHASGVIYLSLTLLSLLFYPFLRKDNPFEKTEKLLIVAILLFFFAAGIAILFGDDASTGYRWFGKFFRLVLVIPLFLLLRHVKVAESQFWYSLAAGAILCGIVAIIEIYIGKMFGWGGGHTGRASGVTHPIMFGDVALSMGVMAFCGLSYFRKRQSWQIILPILAIVLGIVASLLSGSRGSWIAIPAILIVLLWSMRHQIPQKLLATAVVIMTAAPITIYFLPGANVAKRINATFEQIDDYSNEAMEKNLSGNPVGIRLEMWQASWTIFKDSPLLGVGWGNYQTAAKQLVDSGERNPVIVRYRHPHNQYLSSMANGGLLGLGATLCLLLIPFLIFFRASKQNTESIRNLGTAGMVLVVAYAHFALTEGVFERNFTINFYGFYLALITAMTIKKAPT